MKKLIVKSTICLLLFACSLFATSTLTAVSFTVSNQQVGSGYPFTAVTSYSGAGSGLYDIGQVYLAIGGTFPGAPQPHGCIFLLNVVNSQVSLWDDLVQTTTSGGIGSATILQNSQCKIFLAGSTATWNGVNSLTFTGTISPVSYTGSQPIYQAVIPGPNSTAPLLDWVNKGTWTVPMASANGSLLTLESSGPTLLVPYVRFSLPDGSDPYVWDVATKGENYVMTVRDAAPNSQVWARQMFAGIGREANGDRDDIFFKPTLGPSGDNYYAFNATSDPDSVLNNIGWLVGVTDANGYFSGTFTAGPYGANGVSVYVGNSAGSPGPSNADGSQSHSTFLVDSNYVGGFVFWLQHNGTPAAPNIQ